MTYKIFFFVCISMFKNALHLHHAEGGGEQVGIDFVEPWLHSL